MSLPVIIKLLEYSPCKFNGVCGACGIIGIAGTSARTNIQSAVNRRIDRRVASRRVATSESDPSPRIDDHDRTRFSTTISTQGPHLADRIYDFDAFGGDNRHAHGERPSGRGRPQKRTLAIGRGSPRTA